MRYSLFAVANGCGPFWHCRCRGAGRKVSARWLLALELIHTYSLIHDDLPAMDDDDFRRGRPTCHRVYGEAVAILAGDGLLNRAFEVLSDPSRTKAIPPNRLLAIIQEISAASGVLGMVGGQVVDMESEGREIDFPTLEYIHTHKTERSSVPVWSAHSCEGGRETAQALTSVWRTRLSFQIVDDILDITGKRRDRQEHRQRSEKGKKILLELFPRGIAPEPKRL
jgi:geranylgeranyl diphosphate synthase type II